MNRRPRLATVALLLALTGCAEAHQQQTVNVTPGRQQTGYTGTQLTRAQAWLAQPHPALPEGWRYAVLLVTNPRAKLYSDAQPDCGDWAALAVHADGTIRVLCESFRAGGQAAMLLGAGDAVAYDDHDHDETVTLPGELRLVAKADGTAG